MTPKEINDAVTESQRQATERQDERAAALITDAAIICCALLAALALYKAFV